MLECVFDQKFVRRLLEKGIADYETYLVAPETYKDKMNNIAQNYANSIDSDEILLRMFTRIPQIMAEAAKAAKSLKENDQQLLAQLSCSDAFVEVVISASKKDSPATRAAVRAVLDLDQVNWLFGATGMGRYIIAIGEHPGNISFEENTRMVASSLAHSAETFYKPMLLSTLRVTRIDQGSQAGVPKELGSAIFQARDYWQSRYPKLLDLLVDNARLIRNSEAHGHTSIDIKNETISFTNVPSKGTPEKITFTKDELSQYVQSFLNLCLGFQAGFREAQRRLSV
jgi:hypothetical protein